MDRKRKCTNPIPTISDDSDDSETQPSTCNSFSRFLVIESLDKKPITKVSPFIIEKSVKGIFGTVDSVKKMKNECLLIETNRKTISDKILKTTEFCSLKVKTYPHRSLNFSKGVIRCADLSGVPEEEILKELQPQEVSGVRRISFSKDGRRIPTNTLVLTFSNPKLPTSIKVGYLLVKVQVYIPNPLRCFDCQRFGHHESQCKEEIRCGNCGEFSQHNAVDCPNAPKCANCSGQHEARSKDCPVWKMEKDVLKIKYTQGVSFPEARKLAKEKLTPVPQKYSFASITKTTHTSVSQDNSTQYEDFSGDQISVKVIIPTKYKNNKVSESSKNTSNKATTINQSQPSSSQRLQPSSRPTTSEGTTTKTQSTPKETSGQSGQQRGRSPPKARERRATITRSPNKFDCLMEVESSSDKPPRSPVTAPK